MEKTIPIPIQKLGVCQSQDSRFNFLEAASYPRDRSDAEKAKDRDAGAGKTQVLSRSGYKLLIEILEDKSANISEKDDAAMEFGDSDSPLAIEALVKKGQDREEDDIVLDSCGESLAEIWIRNNSFDQRLYDSLLPKARQGARNVIEVLKPEWKTSYKL